MTAPRLRVAWQRAGVAAVVTTAVLTATPSAALASCAPMREPLRLGEYEQVFAGLVVDTSHGGEAAQVDVLDVWHGPDLPEQVVVVAGQLRMGVDSSLDRSYRTGQQYAFFVHRDDRGTLRDNTCTPTGPLDRYADLDPAGVRLPRSDAPAPHDPRSPWRTLAGLGALGMGSLAAAAAITRRRRTAAPAGRRVQHGAVPPPTEPLCDR